MIPISVIPQTGTLHRDIQEWLKDLPDGDYVYLWPSFRVTFWYDEDATAFIIKFGGKKNISRTEQILLGIPMQ
jgi:hypothetical protein